MMPTCTGAGHGDGPDDHCCWVNGKRCRYLVERVDGRRWACGLFSALGSWDAVHEHPGYKVFVQSVWDEVGIESCGAWGPGSGQCCFAETVTPVTVRVTA
jgi:hypothetical protein